ncbi:MAG: NAD-dependent malic enzyme [Chloroflexi bacterium]|nr:NAD-dependent malic enzyme [Chloroflexota bacterium]
MLGRLLSAIGDVGGDIGAIDIVRADRNILTRDITVSARDDEHAQAIVDAIRTMPGVEVINVSDRVFLLHLGGKIEVHSKAPIKTRDDLSMAYTPGVARVCHAIAADPSKAFQLTIKRNTVAVVSDGSAVLGLGNIGPEAALPVMEGKAALFKEFAGVDAFPICLNEQDPGRIVDVVAAIAPVFGGVNLEDISAPRCFKVEDALRQRLDIPVFHDDQHGTAVVVLAAVINACKVVHKQLEHLRVVVNGIGAAGVASVKILLAAGITDIVACDRSGVLALDGPLAGDAQRWIVEHTNPRGIRGSVHDAIRGADLFLGVSGPGVLTTDDLRQMAPDPIVFALANPTPEIDPEEGLGIARVMATGRSDFPNQINNVLAFPGIFRGALDCGAREINEEMKLAAARAIADRVSPEELSEEYIVPSVFNRRVVIEVARAVVDAAIRTGVARRPYQSTTL